MYHGNYLGLQTVLLLTVFVHSSSSCNISNTNSSSRVAVGTAAVIVVT